MKKTVAILILSVWVIRIFLPYLLFMYERVENRQDFINLKPYISEKHISILTFPLNSGLTWRKANKEFEYEGKMHDVITIEKNDSLLIIKCIHDKKDDASVRKYLKLSNHSRKRISKIKLKKLNPYNKEVLKSEFVYLRKEHLFFKNNKKLTSRYHEIITPPPQVNV